MLNALYNVVVLPLVYLIELVYAVLNRFFWNPGISIIGVSLAVNTLCLPLYRRADLLQEEERQKQALMEPWVNHIKRTFKGDEQYMMLSAYYRHQHYKPTQALRSSLSLLLQIPFFMAAYNYLSNLRDLEGTRFLFISDLSQPDQLLAIGALTINVLPILMTVLNCLSTSVYTKGLPLRDKIQAYGLAMVFLVLLYQSPAGLVFYWTCNQLFSLAKNVFLKLVHNPKRVISIIIQLAFVVVGTYLATTGRLSSTRRIIGFVAFVVIVELGLFLPDALSRNQSVSRLGSVVQKCNPGLFLLAALLITATVGILIPSAVINASPTEFIDFTTMANPLRHVATTTLIIGGTVILWGGVYYYLSNDSTRCLIEAVYCALAIICLMDFMFFGRNLGTITKDLVFESNPSYAKSEIVLNAFIVIVAASIVFLLYRKQPALLHHAVVILAVAVVAVSAPNLMSINSEVNSAISLYNAEQGTDSKAAGDTYFNPDGSIKPLIHLSKEGRNVVVLFMDRAMGTYFPYILNERPELEERLEGFTYYPNTLSFGSCTVYGGPALYGGYEYTPDAMNKRSDELLSAKHDEAMQVMPKVFTDAGFHAVQFYPPLVHYSYTTRDYANFDSINNFETYDVTGVYTQYYQNGTGNRAAENLTRSFVFYSIFKAAPVILQTTIYDQGNYYSTLVSHATSSDFIDNYSVLALLDQLTSFDENSSDNYVMLHNDATHSPQMLQLPDYEPSDFVNNDGLEDYSRFTLNGRTMDVTSDPIYLSSYHANMATILRLADWFDTLKAEGVYDNTRIIIVSDHGYPHTQFSDLLFDANEENMRVSLNVNSFNPLFLVKDFDAHDFSVSQEFMTNADTPTIALKDIVDNPINPYTGNPITNEDKYSHDQLVTTSWHHNVNDNHHGTIFETGDGSWYAVHDDIFVRDNWTLVQGPTEE